MLVFLFTDVEGASRLWEDHMDQMAAAIARHDEILQELIENDGGRSTKQTGDGSRAVLMGGSRWSAPWKPSWRFAELAVVERRPKQKRTAAETHSVRW